MTEDEDMERLKLKCSELMEHFDSVRIFVTRHSSAEDGTINCSWGEGNWFASYGQISDWLTRQEERTRIGIRKSDDA